MKDQSDDPLHHERMLLPQSYISLQYYWCQTDITVALVLESSETVSSNHGTDELQYITIHSRGAIPWLYQATKHCGVHAIKMTAATA